MPDTEYNQTLGNGKEGPQILPWPRAGLGNTNPMVTRGPTHGFGGPILPTAEFSFETVQTGALVISGAAAFVVAGGFIANAEVLPSAKAPKPAAPVVLFQKIMEDWNFSDEEAATLLGFEAGFDINQIYLGTKSVEHRDANDRLRAVLRIATDLDALFEEVAAIRAWLREPQPDLDEATPRSLLTEGSMENLLRIKTYVAYLSGRS